jgi:hypothetical protein
MYEMMMSSMKDMEGKDWKPVVNAMSGGRRKHTRKAKHHKKRGTRKH